MLHRYVPFTQISLSPSLQYIFFIHTRLPDLPVFPFSTFHKMIVLLISLSTKCSQKHLRSFIVDASEKRDVIIHIPHIHIIYIICASYNNDVRFTCLQRHFNCHNIRMLQKCITLSKIR